MDKIKIGIDIRNKVQSAGDEFARKYDLPIRVVVRPADGEPADVANMTEAVSNDGVLVNSGEWDGLPSDEARQKLTAAALEDAAGRLRDHLVDQRHHVGDGGGQEGVAALEAEGRLDALEAGIRPVEDNRAEAYVGTAGMPSIRRVDHTLPVTVADIICAPSQS